MKRSTLLFLLLITASFAADRDDLLQRIKMAESIFEERFSSARVERMLARNLVDELSRLEKGPGAEYALRVRRILKDVSLDVSTSKSFKDEYAGWLATQMSSTELDDFYQFLRSDLGRKISDLDDRVQPLLSEAIMRRSKGRLESVPLLLAEARSQ